LARAISVSKGGFPLSDFFRAKRHLWLMTQHVHFEFELPNSEKFRFLTQEFLFTVYSA